MGGGGGGGIEMREGPLVHFNTVEPLLKDTPDTSVFKETLLCPKYAFLM